MKHKFIHVSQISSFRSWLLEWNYEQNIHGKSVSATIKSLLRELESDPAGIGSGNWRLDDSFISTVRQAFFQCGFFLLNFL